MSDLRSARQSMNAAVREALESVDVFDPASLDRAPMPPPSPVGMLVSEALELDDGRAPGWMPWEVIL